MNAGPYWRCPSLVPVSLRAVASRSSEAVDAEHVAVGELLAARVDVLRVLHRADEVAAAGLVAVAQGGGLAVPVDLAELDQLGPDERRQLLRAAVRVGDQQRIPAGDQAARCTA